MASSIDVPPSRAALAELRSRTQLTWAQLARALGVQPRSLHFWARGERPSAANLERLMGVLGIVRAIDRGDPSETTAALLESRGDRPSAFALLCEGRGDEVLELPRPRRRFSAEARERGRRPPHLGREERARRRGGLSPIDRLNARHDADGPPLGRVIATLAIPPRVVFPDDLVVSLRGLVSRVREKHAKDSPEGRALEALEDIRITGSPSWNAEAIDVFIAFTPATRAEANQVMADDEWDQLVESWLRQAEPFGVISTVDGAMIPLDEISALEYIDSDALDLDYLSWAPA